MIQFKGEIGISTKIVGDLSILLSTEDQQLSGKHEHYKPTILEDKINNMNCLTAIKN